MIDVKNGLQNSICSSRKQALKYFSLSLEIVPNVFIRIVKTATFLQLFLIKTVATLNWETINSHSWKLNDNDCLLEPPEIRLSQDKKKNYLILSEVIFILFRSVKCYQQLIKLQKLQEKVGERGAKVRIGLFALWPNFWIGCTEYYFRICILSSSCPRKLAFRNSFSKTSNYDKNIWNTKNQLYQFGCGLVLS